MLKTCRTAERSQTTAGSAVVPGTPKLTGPAFQTGFRKSLKFLRRTMFWGWEEERWMTREVTREQAAANSSAGTLEYFLPKPLPLTESWLRLEEGSKFLSLPGYCQSLLS